MIKVPVLLLTFNRPKSTIKVLKQIKKYKPKKLYISSDGPRINVKNEREKINNLRDEMISYIDWECSLMTFFKKNNQGGPISNAESITWFFKNENEGIILEDDILPSIDFFLFCEYGLKKYKNNKKILTIGGYNFGVSEKIDKTHYYYSSILSVWGWATWKETWNLFSWDNTQTSLKKRVEIIKYYFNKQEIIDLYSGFLNRKNWDFALQYQIWKNQGLTLIPNHCLTKNIGFNKEASNTKFNKQFLIYSINQKIKLKNRFKKKISSIKGPKKIIHKKEIDIRIIKILFLDSSSIKKYNLRQHLIDFLNKNFNRKKHSN